MHGLTRHGFGLLTHCPRFVMMAYGFQGFAMHVRCFIYFFYSTMHDSLFLALPDTFALIPK
jgi:hypothetical protein